MSRDPVKDIADAVLYEGFVLYPYRPSSIKNCQRWTFGGVFPQSFSVQSGSDRYAMQTECLVEAGPDATLTVQLRFLHLVVRDILQFDSAALNKEEAETVGGNLVAAIEIDGQQYAAWEEALDREIMAPRASLAALSTECQRMDFAFPKARERELLLDHAGHAAGAISRTRHALQGTMILSAAEIAPKHYRLTVRVENNTILAQDECENRALAQRGAFASTHAILRIENGGFISLTDPPEPLTAAAKACVNEGCWPVLAGAAGSHDAMLASPIILYDYPQIAPESPGDLFDATEIDEILTLRILTMTDAEKHEAAAADPRIRTLIARTEALTAEDMARLHGVLRSPRSHPKPALVSLAAGGRDLRAGDRVLLKPKPGGDIMDIVLAGKIAIIELIERDFEDRMHVAVTIEDDPGRNFELDRYPGHRFFFSADELEPVAGETAL